VRQRPSSSGASSGLHRAVGAVGPHRLDRRVLLAAAEHHRRQAPPPPLETGATAYSDMAFQIWTSSVSSRRTLLSACHGTRHLAQWTRTEMSGGRERERGRRPEQGGAYLVKEPDPAHRSPWWWRKGHLALDGDPPLRDAVEGHVDLVLRVGLRVDLRERDGDRSRESERV
jgi:hypothetical protein